MPESDGLVIIRILPAASEKIKDIFEGTRMHFMNRKWLHCPRERQGERWAGNCPICDYYQYLYTQSRLPETSNDEAAQLVAEASSIKPIERYNYNVIVRSQTGQFRGGKGNELNVPLIYAAGKQVHARILRAIIGSEEDQEPALGDVTDPKNGRDFKIMKKTRKGSDNRTFPYYEDSKFLEPSILGTAAQVKGWMASLHDLKAIRDCKSVDELKREIRIHRKVEKDPREEGFDPAEFGILTQTRRQAEPVRNTPPPREARQNVSLDLSDEDQVLLEDDFLRKLNEVDVEH
jgi:hypothetical protein